jgi:hypothetical protein
MSIVNREEVGKCCIPVLMQYIRSVEAEHELELKQFHELNTLVSNIANTITQLESKKNLLELKIRKIETLPAFIRKLYCFFMGVIEWVFGKKDLTCGKAAILVKEIETKTTQKETLEAKYEESLNKLEKLRVAINLYKSLLEINTVLALKATEAIQYCEKQQPLLIGKKLSKVEEIEDLEEKENSLGSVVERWCSGVAIFKKILPGIAPLSPVSPLILLKQQQKELVKEIHGLEFVMQENTKNLGLLYGSGPQVVDDSSSYMVYYQENNNIWCRASWTMEHLTNISPIKIERFETTQKLFDENVSIKWGDQDLA